MLVVKSKCPLYQCAAFFLGLAGMAVRQDEWTSSEALRKDHSLGQWASHPWDFGEPVVGAAAVSANVLGRSRCFSFLTTWICSWCNEIVPNLLLPSPRCFCAQALGSARAKMHHESRARQASKPTKARASCSRWQKQGLQCKEGRQNPQKQGKPELRFSRTARNHTTTRLSGLPKWEIGPMASCIVMALSWEMALGGHGFWGANKNGPRKAVVC